MSENNSNSLKVIAIPLILVVGFVGLILVSSLNSEKQITPSMRQNKPIPFFSAEVLFESRTASSKDLLGQYTLLNFWGSWCVTCFAEHGYLMSLQERGFHIVGVNYKDTTEEAGMFLSKMGNPYQFSFFDPKGLIAIEMGITAAPETFLISPEGVVLAHHIGEMREDVWKAKFSKHIVE